MALSDRLCALLGWAESQFQTDCRPSRLKYGRQLLAQTAAGARVGRARPSERLILLGLATAL